MKTKSQTISKFVDRYPGATVPAKQQDLFDTAYRRLMDRAEFRTNDVPFMNIVAGTAEYPWAETSLRGYNGTWWIDANTPIPMKLTSEDGLRDQQADWKEQDSLHSGRPCQFYIGTRPNGNSAGLVIGFVPTPDTSTSSGFPYAVIHVEEHVVLGLDDPLPYSMIDEMALVYRMCQLWAEEQDRQAVGMWKQMADDEDVRQIEHLQQLLPEVLNASYPPQGAMSAPLL